MSWRDDVARREVAKQNDGRERGLCFIGKGGRSGDGKCGLAVAIMPGSHQCQQGKGVAISGVSTHIIIGGKLREKNKRNERGLKVPSQFGSTGFNSGGFWGATCRVYVSFIFLETLKIVLIIISCALSNNNYFLCSE